MWCGITWCSALFVPTTSIKRKLPSSRCSCWRAGRTPKSRARRRRQKTSNPEKPRENKAQAERRADTGPSCFVLRRVFRKRWGKGGYPPKKNRRAEPIDLGAFCVAGETSGPFAGHGECAGDKQFRVAGSQPAIPWDRQAHGRAVVSHATGGVQQG